MASTSTLQGLDGASFGYLWLVDGIWMGFTDDSRLEVADFTGHGHTIRAYLETEGTATEEALDLRSSRLDDLNTTIDLVDYDGELAALFAAEDPTEEPLEVTIYPSDDLAAMTQVHERHVGTEYIGTGGARHRFPCVPSFQVGLEHLGRDQELPHHRPAPVSENPIVWAGRRCALYRCYFDVDGTRRPFSEAQRIWWGTIIDQGEVEGVHWSLRVAGPESWLQRDLGHLTQDQPVYAIGTLTLSDKVGEDETRIGVCMRREATSFAYYEDYGVREYVAQITETVPADIIAQISAELATASSTAGTDGTFSAAQNRWVSIDSSGKFGVHIDDTGSDQSESVVYLVMHRKVWAALGYNVDEQLALPAGDQYYVRFTPNFGGSSLLAEPPGAGYVQARISTKARNDDGLPRDNGGNPRYWYPRYQGGTTTLLANLNDGEGQIVDLGDGFGSQVVYHRGQLSRPVASDPADHASPYPVNGDANRQGLWLFYGKRRFGDREFDEYQVGEASWRGGSIGQQGQVIGGRIVVTRWYSPSRFGFDRPRLSTDWVARANADKDYRIKAVPILGLYYLGGDALEEAAVVIERLLRTTGTSAGWSSYSLDNPTLAGGDNDSAGIVRRDAEVADLGLAIPDEMVADLFTFASAQAALPSGLGRVKVAFSPGMPSDELLEGLMRPFGWAWTLRGGRYGIFDPHRTPAPGEVDVVLDASVKAGKQRSRRETPIQQQLRAFAPIDSIELEYSWAPFTGKFRDTVRVTSADIGRRYRRGGILDKHKAHGVRQLDGWAQRSRQITDWWSKRHFPVKRWPYMDREPRHVGEFVRFSDPRGVNPVGTYSIDGMIGVITRVQNLLRPGRDEPHAYLDLLIYANSGTAPRLHAMSARAYGLGSDRIYVRRNWLGFYGSPWPGDASYFVEPAFPGVEALGGDLEVTIVQRDGQWRTPITGSTCVGWGTDEIGDYLLLDPMPAEYYHRMDTVVIAAQRGTLAAAFALAYYGVTCGADGQFDGTPGFRWEDQ